MDKSYPKRFWNKVSVQKIATTASYGIMLDDKKVATPARNPLILDNEALIYKIAEEWEHIQQDVHPGLMPLSRLAMTYIDQLQDRPEALKAWLNQGLEYLSTDLLLFPSHQPKKLRMQEDLLWLPLIDKAQILLNFTFKQSEDLQVDGHNQRIGNSIFASIYALNALAASVFPCLVYATGSVILALLILQQQISLEDTINACQIQENYQKKLWGDDPEQEAQLKMQTFEIKQFFCWADCCSNNGKA